MHHGQQRDHLLARIIAQIRDRTFPYEPREDKLRDWSSYDEAQVNELDDVLNLIRRSVDQVPRLPEVKHRNRGRPPEHDEHDLAKIVLLQQYFGASNRVMEGYSRVFLEKLRLSRSVPYKAIERAYDDPRVKRVLDDVFALTQQPERGRVTGMTVDGSGLPESVKQNWERDKSAKKGNGRFDGSVVMLTVPHQIITAHTSLRAGFENESPLLEPLLDQTRQHHPYLGIVSADAAFLSRKNCTLIENAGGIPRIAPKKNVTVFKRIGSDAWIHMLMDLIADPQAWLRDYHQRSLSETGWSTHKRRHPRPLRRRIPYRRVSEKHARFTVDNLVRLAYLSRLHEVKIEWKAGSAA